MGRVVVEEEEDEERRENGEGAREREERWSSSHSSTLHTWTLSRASNTGTVLRSVNAFVSHT